MQRNDVDLGNLHPWTRPTPTDPSGDVLLEHLRTAMVRGGYGLKSQGACGIAQILTPQDGELSTKLLVCANKRRDKVMWKVLGDSPESITNDRKIWEKILQEAKRIHDSAQPATWNWATFISPDPRLPGWHSLRLSKTLDLGPVKFVPGEYSIVESHRDHSNRFHIYPVGYWPIIVAGQVQMHRRGYAHEAAARTLRKACAFFSFISNSWLDRITWTPGYLPDVTPLDAPYHDAVHRVFEASTKLSPERPPEPIWNDFDPPDWSIEAWSRLEGAVERALVDAYTNAVQDLAANKSSVAAVLLSAALEGIDKPVPAAPRGPGKRTPAKGSLVRSINQVLGDESIAERIYDAVYAEGRSETAHSGTMFGYETRLGMGSHTASLIPDAAHDYARQVVVLQQICRERLLVALGAPRDLSSDRLIERWRDIESGVITMRSGQGMGPYGHA